MTSKIKALKEPFILTESYLREHLLEDIKKVEVRRVIEEDGLDLSKVLSLDLERHYILNITCLWRFTSLEILKMPNNIIEKIEGLENLTNLRELDLSFNYIERITGLEELINLKHLNLTSNEIMVVENMESLKQLETFLIRHNKIKFFDSISYLRQFENLLSLGIGNNPVIQNKEVELSVIAALPRLKYLDHRLIKERKTQALENLPIKDNAESCGKSKEVRTQADINDDEKQSLVTMQEMKTLHFDAYVDGLINGQLFHSMFQNDNHCRLLVEFPPAHIIADEYFLQVELICQEWFETGLKLNEYREKEKEMFYAGISSTKSYITDTIRKEISEFISLRRKVMKELGLIYLEKSDKIIDENVTKLKDVCNNKLCELWRTLMKFTALRVEIIDVMSQNLRNTLSLINKKYLEEIEKYPKRLEEVDVEFAVRLVKFYKEWLDSESSLSYEFKDKKGNIIELNPEILKLIQDENFVEFSLLRGRNIHLAAIDERMEIIKSRMKNAMQQKLKEIQEEENKKYKENSKEVALFCDEQHVDLTVFFLSLEMEDNLV